jgi:hypothetical protein
MDEKPVQRIVMRLRGKFAWPPGADGNKQAPDTPGTVEIGYRQIDGKGPFHGYLHWIPDGIQAVDSPAEVPAAGKYTPAQLAGLDHEKPAALRIALLPEEFLLRGGSWFELFENIPAKEEDTSSRPQPVCRVPLRLEPESGRTSWLAKGTDASSPGFGVTLNLPVFEDDPAKAMAPSLLTWIRIPDKCDALPHHINIPKAVSDDRFLNAQVAAVLSAIGVSPTASVAGMTLEATVEGAGIVYRFRNVPWTLFPSVKEGRAIVCHHLSRVVIAHTAAREFWIDTGLGGVRIDVGVRWRGADNHDATASGLPKPSRESLTADVSLAITWDEILRARTMPPEVEARSRLPCLSLTDLLEKAFDDATSTREGLAAVAGGQPQTFLPQVDFQRRIGRQFVARASEPVEATHEPWARIRILPRSDALAMHFTIADGDIPATIAWPGFDGKEAAENVWNVNLRGTDSEDTADDPSTGASDWLAGFDLFASREIPLGVGRLGSLRLSRAVIRPAYGRIGRIVIRTPRSRPIAETDAKHRFTYRPQTEFSFRFPLSAVDPVGTDIPWGEREIDVPPFFVPLEGDSGASPSPGDPFLLDVRESIGPDTDRWLVATLFDKSLTVTASLGSGGEEGQPTANRYVLIATEPFGILRFSRQPLEESGDAGDAGVAVFDSDTRTWLFKKVSEEYRYDYPPQGIGEGADKPGRWEIHDLAADGPGSADIIAESGTVGRFAAVVRPAPQGQTTKSYVVDCRFSPSTTLWIRPGDLERNYFLPEWSAHEIFRQQNDLGIGAALSALRGEFLYGLAVAVSTRNEVGAARGARVAEIEALTGRLPKVNYTEKPEPALLRRWGALRRALKTRHERLEIWTPAPGDPRPFAPARFKEGVRYALRLDTASTRPPLEDKQQVTEGLGSPEDFGLPGGALWPIESQVFYDSILQKPQSSGGTIERIAIGPTGGDADLRAEFLGGTLAVVAEVRGGFVQRQRVEIIGRIGVLWHRAKHVVVYERTVNPSAQFAPERDPDGWSRFRSRRPIVRKVSEFVELMEPVRKYPDLGSTDARSCGFLDSVRFNSRTINVDSAWAVDVTGDDGKVRGYALPLWNRGAARRRPQVYPEPDVAFVTIGEGKEDRPVAAQGCLDNDNLWFYAEPTPGGNPDAWPDVFGVDWGHVLPPSVIDEQMTPGGDRHEGPEGGRKAPVPRCMPGYRRFTWRLARADTKTAVNAAYGEKPVFVGLDSVTFSRRMPAAVPESPESKVKQFRDHAASIARAGSFLSDIETAIKENPLQAVKKLGKSLPAPDFWNQLQGSLDAIRTSTAPLGCSDCNAGCERISGQLKALLNAKGRLLARSMRELVLAQSRILKAATTELAGQIQSAWNDLTKYSEDPERRLARTLASSCDVVQKAIFDTLDLGESRADVLLNEIEKTKALLHHTIGEIRIALETVCSRLDCVNASFDSRAAWAKGRSESYLRQISESLADVPSRMRGEVDEAKHRFASELGPLALPAIKQADSIFGGISDFIGDVSAAIPTAPATPEAWDECNAYRVQVVGRLRGVIQSLEAISKAVDGAVEEAFSASSVGLTKLVEAGDEELRKAARDILNVELLWVTALRLARDEAGRIVSVIEGGVPLLQEEVKHFGERLEDKVDSLVASFMEGFTSEALGKVASITDRAEKICDDFSKVWNEYTKELISVPQDWDGLIKAVDALEGVLSLPEARKWFEDNRANAAAVIQSSSAAWHSYSGVVSERLTGLRDGGIAAAPGNALRLISAATTAPEIGILQANADRVRCSYEDARVRVTKAKAALNRLGDALKAMGIDIPFDGIGDTLTLPEGGLDNLDLTKMFPNFGGLDLRSLLPDVKVPQGVKDAVRITHDFDRKQLRAWVQVDVDVPVPGQQELYAIGPVALYFRDSKLTGRMRAEASKDDDAVRDSGSGEIATNIDVVVSGEPLLSLEQVRITYSGTGGLKFDFDPKNIRLHPSMQFVQDTFGELFADEIGGMTVLKEQGVPVGVEHLFSLPTIDLMSGTTGVANIQISNLFRLRAHPDFVIANRFNLSRADAPFLFTFFILGGTGYTFVDTSYSPLTNRLAVTVEAAAGGAAAFGFSAGPVKGSVFITLSLAITYRKVFGGGPATGEGLAVSVILVIAGNVSLYGMVDVYLGLLLRIMYREGGRIDGVGTLTVKVKVSKLVTLKYNSQVTYTLRNGRATTTLKSEASAELDQEQQAKLTSIKDRRDKLIGARA